jgi:hypothetical protein
MIQHHGDFAVQLPSGWTAPKFQFGQSVQVRERTGQITGLDHYTSEQADAAGCSEGWWYFVLEPRTLSNGGVIADVIGYHESVIQPLPYLPPASYGCRVAV